MAKRRMSREHKEALAEGRRLGNDVRAYLEALENHRPRRGRRRTAESVKARLDRVTERLESASALDRLQLAQERIDLQRELAAFNQSTDLAEVEERFVQSAKDYSRRKGISYPAWREAGVPAEVLRKAGISRGFDPNA